MNEVKKLSQIINKRNSQIKHLKKYIDQLRKELKENTFDFFNLEKGEKVYIESVTYEQKIRTYLGYVDEESSRFIKLIVYDSKNLDYYSYIIPKKFIGGIKVYNVIFDIDTIKEK